MNDRAIVGALSDHNFFWVLDHLIKLGLLDGTCTMRVRLSRCPSPGGGLPSGYSARARDRRGVPSWRCATRIPAGQDLHDLL